jgi:hypothetical protein
MKNSNDNTFDPGLLLSGEDTKPKVTKKRFLKPKIHNLII